MNKRLIQPAAYILFAWIHIPSKILILTNPLGYILDYSVGVNLPGLYHRVVDICEDKVPSNNVSKKLRDIPIEQLHHFMAVIAAPNLTTDLTDQSRPLLLSGQFWKIVWTYSNNSACV